MNLSFTHSFDADAERVALEFMNPDVYTELAAVDFLGETEVIDSASTPNTKSLSIRRQFTADLPSVATKILKTNDISWVEHTTLDVATLHATVEFVPDVAEQFISARAAWTVVALAHNSSERSTTGTLAVHVPLVGGRAERVIASGIGDFLTSEAEALNTLLSEPA